MKKTPRNLTILFLTDIASHVLGFGATVYIARIIGLEGFGMISYGLAFLNYALLASNPGLTTIGTRVLVKDLADRRVADSIVSTRLVLAALIFVLILIGTIVIPGGLVIKNIVVSYSFALFPCAAYLEFVFQGREEMEYVGLARFLQYAAYLMFLLILLKNQNGILAIPYCFTFSYLLAAFFLILVFTRKYGFLKFSFSFAAAKSLLFAAVPVGIATLLYQFAINLPPLILGITAGPAEVGRYSAGYKILVLLLIIERVFYYVFFPIAARQFKQAPDRLTSTFNGFCRIITAITIPTAAAGLVLASRIVLMVFGADYLGAVPAFQILLLYFLITPVNSVLGYGLVAMEKESLFLRNTAITAVAAAVLIAVAGRSLGSPGAAGGLLVAETIGLILMVIEVRRFVRFNILLHLGRQLLATAGLVLLLLVLVALFPGWHLFILVVIGAAAYIVGLYFLRGYTQPELAALYAAFTKN